MSALKTEFKTRHGGKRSRRDVFALISKTEKYLFELICLYYKKGKNVNWA
jgi:hypothetical protein